MMNRSSIYDLRFTICDLRTAIGASRTVSLIVVLTFLSGNFAIAEKILLKDATVHTVSGETLSPGQVLFDGAKILEVGTTVEASGAKIISLKGQHVYPGLIALDTTTGLSEISGVRSTRDFSEVGEYTPDVESWISVNPDSVLIPVTRANGITHIQPAPRGGIVAGQSSLVALNGWTTEEMTLQKTAALHLYWPNMGLDTRRREAFSDKSKWKSLEDQAKERREKLRSLEEFFEEARAYEKTSTQGNHKKPERVPAWEAMLPFIRGESPVLVHADEVRQIKAALDWAKQNKLKIVLVGGRDAWQMAGQIAAENVPVIYEHIFNQPARDVDRYDVNFRAPEILRAVGVTFALGMGADPFDAALVKNLPYTVAQSIAFGLPEADALKSITLVPATLLGVADRLGSIEPGKEATLVVTDGNIFDIRSNVKRLWIAGSEVELETRHTRFYEKYKNRPKP